MRATSKARWRIAATTSPSPPTRRSTSCRIWAATAARPQSGRCGYSGARYEVRTILAEGDKVAALLRVFFRKRANERMVQFDLADFYTLRDGRIIEIRELLDSFD